MVYVHKDPTLEAKVIALLRRERRQAQNREDWERALRNHGYRLDRQDAGIVVTTLPHGIEVCRLPSDLVRASHPAYVPDT